MTLLTSEETEIPGVHIVQRKAVFDSRGFFERIYCDAELASVFGNKKVVQINRSFNEKSGTLRGLHFQKTPHQETKMVSCLRGEVFDVAVDLRPSSPTFLQWHAEVLSASNHTSLLIPEGFAHGFQTLSAECELLYLHTAPFSEKSEAGVNALDPKLGISWPLPVLGRSSKDENLPFITPEYLGADT